MKKCFVVMPIGEQKYEGETITAAALKERYTDLIKESIASISPEIEIVRADDISTAGPISRDIFERIITSDYVVADITYPNPNVFYELGLRHATRNKTILIKERNSRINPFDIAGLRYVQYENTPSGLKKLKEELKKAFLSYESNDTLIDNEFLHVLQTTKKDIDKAREQKQNEAKKKALAKIMQDPKLMQALVGKGKRDAKISQALSQTKGLEDMISSLVDAGVLDD